MNLEIQRISNNKVHSSDFNPYSFNSGTSLAISSTNYIILASDMRHNSEYTINDRNTSKIFQINQTFLATTGFFADSNEVFIKLNYQAQIYNQECNKTINVPELAHCLCNILYSKRLFPHFSYCILASFDNLQPTIYAYDPVGSYEKVRFICNGTAAPMIQPALDTFVDRLDSLSKEDAVLLVKKLFESATERDVKTGDRLEIVVLERENVERMYFELRKD